MLAPHRLLYNHALFGFVPNSLDKLGAAQNPIVG
jgi:hypothetical protein